MNLFLLFLGIVFVFWFFNRYNQNEKQIEENRSLELRYIGEKFVYCVKSQKILFPPFDDDFHLSFPFETFPPADYLDVYISEVNEQEKTYKIMPVEKAYKVTVHHSLRGWMGLNHAFDKVFFEPLVDIKDGQETYVRVLTKGKEIKIVHCPNLG